MLLDAGKSLLGLLAGAALAMLAGRPWDVRLAKLVFRSR